jgi:hypothetical protein
MAVTITYESYRQKLIDEEADELRLIGNYVKNDNIARLEALAIEMLRENRLLKQRIFQLEDIVNKDSLTL